MDWNGFKGAAKRLDDIDLPRIGSLIGVGEDELHAFMDVEASGSGFDAKGRPKILFEPHVFYRNLTGARRDRAVREGLAYQKWGQKPYPKDSYPRLVKAMAIDESAALKAASWGLTQILGENHTMVGYATVQQMVSAFMADEENHLKAMVDFLIAAGIADDLKAHRWDTVARGYNGPKYAAHDYDGRMKAAFAKWQKVKDTAWSPGQEPTPAAAQPTPAAPSKPAAAVAAPEPAAFAPAPAQATVPTPRSVVKRAAEIAHKEMITDVQSALRATGFFEVGNVDGKMGDRTRGAISSYRSARGLPLSEDIDEALLADMEKAVSQGWKRPVSEERGEATKADLMGSAVLQNTDRATRHINVGQQLMTWLGIGGAVAGGANEAINPDQVDERLGVLQRVGDFAAHNWWLVIILAAVVCGILYMRWAKERVGKAENEEVQGYREGRHV